ncbi:MerR family transcriptional regulator [soil metagenome]
MRFWKVGELARQTGLTVRTLHHYEEIGLLAPARRSESGYRLYSEEDVVRLQQIVSLRQLGLSLEEVGRYLARPGSSPLEVLELHLSRLRKQIELQQRLCARLEALAAHVRSAETLSAEEFTRTIEMMTMFEKYYTPEQLQELEERRRVIGDERIREVEAEWPVLIAEMRAEMEKGTDPASERVQELARRWMGLVQEFTGGNPQIEQSVSRLYQQEPAARERMGLDPEIFGYINRAMQISRE